MEGQGGRTHSRMPTGIELEAHKGQQGRGSNPNLNPAAAAAGKHRKPRSHPPAKARQARAQGTATQSQEAKGTTRHTRLSTLSKGCDSNSVSNQPAIKQPQDGEHQLIHEVRILTHPQRTKKQSFKHSLMSLTCRHSHTGTSTHKHTQAGTDTQPQHPRPQTPHPIRRPRP